MTLLKSVEDQCSRLATFALSEMLSKSMKIDALLIQKQRSPNPLFSEVRIASNFARDVHQKLLKSLLFRVSHYVWATESFLPLLSKVSSIDSVCRAIVGLVDATHPRAFQSEWFESPSHKTSTVTNDRGKPMRTSLLHDSTASSEKSRRHWQCMLPENIICDLAKKQTSFDAWIRSTKPELATLTVQKNRRKRERKFVTPTSRAQHGVGDKEKKIQSLQLGKKLVEQTVNETNDGNGEGYRFRNRQETMQKPALSLAKTDVLARTEIENEQQTLIASILGGPRENWFGDANWPIAGRRLFEPVGELPTRDIRRLARRAGSVRSPFVLYSFEFEVGQASCYHVWRKHMLSCHVFEDMLLGIRALEIFLDADVIRQAATQARKCSKKGAPEPDIYCCNTDISSGEHEYLALDKSGFTGSWKSSRSIEIKSLIPYQFQKVADIKSKRQAILQKRKHDSARKAKKPVVKTSQSLSVAAVATPTAPGLQKGSLFQIYDRHNEEIYRLLMVYTNNMSLDFSKARDFIRSETLARLQTTVSGAKVDVQNVIGYLAKAEKEFLEGRGRGNATFMRLLNYLYPQVNVTGSLPTPVGNPRGSKTSQEPSLTQSVEKNYRHIPKSSRYDAYDRTRLGPSTTSVNSSETFPGSAGDSMAVVTSRDRQASASSYQHRTSHESTRTNPPSLILQRNCPVDSHVAAAHHAGSAKNERYSTGNSAAQDGTASVSVAQGQNFSSSNKTMNYQSSPSPLANGSVSNGQFYSGKSPSIPDGMNFRPNTNPRALNQHGGTQRMPVNLGGKPSSTATSDRRRFELFQNRSRGNTAPNYGRNQQSSSLPRIQNGRPPSHPGWNSQATGARPRPELVQRASYGVGNQSQPPYLYSQNGQASTDPLQYLPQQAKTDQGGTGSPSKSSSWFSAPHGLNGFQYPTSQRNQWQMSSQNPQFSNSSGAEATQSMNWSQGGNQRRPNWQAGNFHDGMSRTQGNFTSRNASIDSSFDSLMATQSSSRSSRTQVGQFPQHMSGQSSASTMMAGMSEQNFLGGLEPTPLRPSPQYHRRQQQRAVTQGPTNTMSEYPTNDFIFDDDFLSPTPIHPDHELNQPHHYSRQHTGVIRQNPLSSYPQSQQQQQPQPQWFRRGQERFPPSDMG